ncbi:MAG: protein-L-isoaspartate O-methyltransferase [Patescibacteria group bacterium]|nr:protein-L-isoaspartate O-methyltransferase [Patescibacteria group bacterium]
MTREDLIAELIEQGCLHTPALIRAFQNVDRGDFVPDYLQKEAYENYPLPIGLGQTMSQPLTVAFMFELLMPQIGNTILEIGAGSGWQTTLLGYVVSEGTPPDLLQHVPNIIAVERLSEIKKMAERNIAKYGMIERGIVKIALGDGSKGNASHVSYDRIISAASAHRVPVAWKEQLRIGGRIVAPVDDTIEVHEKITSSDFNIRIYHGFSFVPLVEDDGGDGYSG